MAFFYVAEYTGFAALMERNELTTRGQRVIMSQTHKDVGRFWHNTVLPRHFKKDAHYKYGYKKRKKPYSRIKKELAKGKKMFIRGELEDDKVIEGGRIDIIRGGKTRERTKNAPNIVGTAKGATIYVRVPRYVSRRRRGDFPNMAKELTSLTQLDRVGMSEIMQIQFIQHIKELGPMFVRKRIGAAA